MGLDAQADVAVWALKWHTVPPCISPSELSGHRAPGLQSVYLRGSHGLGQGFHTGESCRSQPSARNQGPVRTFPLPPPHTPVHSHTYTHHLFGRSEAAPLTCEENSWPCSHSVVRQLHSTPEKIPQQNQIQAHMQAWCDVTHLTPGLCDSELQPALAT